MLLLLSVLLTGTTGVLSAQDIVKKASEAQYYAGKDGRAIVRLLIKDKSGRKMKRQFIVVRKDIGDGGEQQLFVLFQKPADVRNTTFLVKKKPEADDDRWLYLPALDLVKRIAASDERTRFVGSHLFYEDISGRGPSEDIHQIIEDTPKHWTIESKPKKPRRVEFSKYVVRIRKKDNIAEEIEYFDARSRVMRRITAVNIEDIDGYPTITRMKVEDLQRGGTTLAAFSQISYDIGVPSNIYVERSLRSPPSQWLRVRK